MNDLFPISERDFDIEDIDLDNLEAFVDCYEDMYVIHTQGVHPCDRGFDRLQSH